MIPTHAQRPPARVTWLDLLAVMAVTVAVFGPVMRSGFSPLDDAMMLVTNRNMTEPSWAGFQSFWTTATFRIYMPLANSVWFLVSLVSYHTTAVGLRELLPFWFKIVSIGTHAVSAAAAVWTLSLLTRSRFPAIVGGLIFALHPVQVESVAWTTGLKDELCGLFSFLAISCYVLHARRDRVTPWGDLYWWLTLAAAVLAMLSKPTAMVLPVVLTVVDWTVRQCPPARRFVSLGVFVLPALVCGMIALAVQANAPIPPVSLPLRPLVAGDTFAFYFRKVVWPVALSVDYGRQPAVVIAGHALWWTWLIPAAALVAVAAARSRMWWLAAALFVVPVLPVSGVTTFDMQQYSTVADHYLYQPMLGVGLAVALLLRRWTWPAGVLALPLLAALSVLSWRTAGDWQSVENLYERVLERNPRSGLALDLLSIVHISRGDLFTARRMTDTVLRENPNDGVAIADDSYLLLLNGHYRESADRGLQAASQPMVERADLGKRLALLGAKLQDRDLAEAGVRYWLKADPANPFARDMLGRLILAKQRAAATRAVAKPATASSR